MTWRCASRIGRCASWSRSPRWGGGVGSSNREVSEAAGVTDQGQISKLLVRLEHLGLIANGGEGHARGEPNAWRLTPKGRDVERTISRQAQTTTH